jgi:hypothetical protein
MLYRVLIVSETVGGVGRSAGSVVDILGASERNNRRDAIGSAMLFYEGQAAILFEGMRADVDRLLKRLFADPRHRNLQILADRPIVQRRLIDPVRLYALSPEQGTEYLHGRRLEEVQAEGLERLLSCDKLRMSACAA